MIAFEVSLNGERVCVAGADDLGVLSTIVTASGKLGKNTVPTTPDEACAEVYYSVVGLTSRRDQEKDVHLRWKSVEALQIGDVVQVKVIETGKADHPKSRTRAKPRRNKTR